MDEDPRIKKTVKILIIAFFIFTSFFNFYYMGPFFHDRYCNNDTRARNKNYLFEIIKNF